MVENAVNRVETELLAWRSREERFEQLFPGSLATNISFLSEKLQFLERLDMTYNRRGSVDEKLVLKVLKGEKSAVEKKLYPNLFERLIRRLWSALARYRKASAINRSFNRDIDELIDELKEIVRKAGFNGLDRKIDVLVREGKNQSVLHISFYLKEQERIDYDLSIIRNNEGSYVMESYKATLHYENGPDGDRKQTFYPDLGQWINSSQAANLLEGRAVMIESMDINGYRESIWKQLDFTDRDSEGNYVIKEFPASYGFDLKKEVNRLPVGNDIKETLLIQLAEGRQGEITVNRPDGKQIVATVTTEPHRCRLQLKDAKGKPISLEKILHDGQRPVVIRNNTRKTETREMGKIVKMRLSKGKSL